MGEPNMKRLLLERTLKMTKKGAEIAVKKTGELTETAMEKIAENQGKDPDEFKKEVKAKVNETAEGAKKTGLFVAQEVTAAFGTTPEEVAAGIGTRIKKLGEKLEGYNDKSGPQLPVYNRRLPIDYKDMKLKMADSQRFDVPGDADYRDALYNKIGKYAEGKGYKCAVVAKTETLGSSKKSCLVNFYKDGEDKQ